MKLYLTNNNMQITQIWRRAPSGESDDEFGTVKKEDSTAH